MDVGASTGGFTDCLLQAGAEFVYAVDVGYGQIAWSLRTDARVKVFERINARLLNRHILQAADPFFRIPDLAVIDVSFISLLKVLPAVKECLANDSSEIIALVKPQFEAGREHVGKGGVVRSTDVHIEVISRIVNESKAAGLFAQDLTFSPLKGPQGNIEFLLLFRKLDSLDLGKNKIESIVKTAALTLVTQKD